MNRASRLYRFLHAVVRVLVAVLFPLRVTGADRLPPEGGAILCSNHISLLDPVILAIAIDRPVRYMAKVELFKPAWFGKFLTMLGAFPVRRGQSDLSALRAALGIVKDGELLGIFAQGHRDKAGEMKMESGVSLIALRSGAAVVPVYMAGPYRLFRRFRLSIGRPVDLSAYGGKCDSEALRSATDDIERSVRALATCDDA